MFHHRPFQRVLPCLILCTAFAVGAKTRGKEPGPRDSDTSLSGAPAVNLTTSTAGCQVEPLPAITDAAALAFEKSESPDTQNLKPAMARALETFRRLVSSVGGTLHLKSAYRPSAYQEHLQAVWFKWMELRNKREPVCQALRAEVGEEFARHQLLKKQKPVTSSDHTRGLAFDATVVMPLLARWKKGHMSLDRLALQAGIQRPDIRRDPVHYRLATGRGSRRV